MNENLVTVKTAIVAGCTALGAFLGWKGVMIAVVLVAAITDWIMVLIAQYIPIGIQWPGIILPLVLAWYIITELGSILENAVKLGANVPSWLVKLLKASADIVASAGDMAAETENEKEKSVSRGF